VTIVTFFKVQNSPNYLGVTLAGSGEEELVARINRKSGEEERGEWKAIIVGRKETPIFSSATACKAYIFGYFDGQNEARSQEVDSESTAPTLRTVGSE
jgi:hypothetical protein